jgi:hypothetical protein
MAWRLLWEFSQFKKGEFMKSVKALLAAAVILASSTSFAASICTLNGYSFMCDGAVAKERDGIKEHNITLLAQELLNKGYKLNSTVTSGNSGYMTMVFVKE